ncbi:ferritin-like domain-containing protein [Cladochytrium replicatum]|nr:ferritin-like domain-containing protein [Cladochytrium replicatum]
MHFFSTFVASSVIAAAAVSAAPVILDDAGVLNFACLLEDLENSFYKLCTTKFNARDYTDAGFPGSTFEQFLLINDHENTHLQTLRSTIQSVFGNNKLNRECREGCTYKFPVNSAKDCVTIAGILEGVGTSAYDGAIRFVDNDDLKNAGAAIATVEGRHTSFLNILNKRFPIPNAFDTPLSARTIFTLAAGFVDKCNIDLKIEAFPSLSVEKADNLKVDDVVKAKFNQNLNNNQLDNLRCTYVFGLAQKSVRPDRTPSKNGNDVEVECKIPSDVAKFGEFVLFIADSDKTISVADDSPVVAGPALLGQERITVELVR